MRTFRFSLLVASLLAAAAVPAVAAPPQSPIKFENAVNRNLPLPVFAYPAMVDDLELTTSWHSAEIGINRKPETKEVKGTPPANAATLTIKNNVYKLDSFHFHKPAEHVLAAQVPPAPYPLELHLVHKRVVGGKTRFLAVGLWIEPTLSLGDPGNAALNQIADDLPEAPNGPGAVDDADGMAEIDGFKLADLLLTDQENFFSYNGSLTTFKKNREEAAMVSRTPVKWIFFKKPLELSQMQITKLAGHVAMTDARPWFVMDQNTHKLAMYMKPVPEPSTLWLLAVAGLFVGRRRSGRAAAVCRSKGC